jgi:tRNA-binding EMAP/Myf-like protein
MISIDELKRIEIRIGEIKNAEKVLGADKLFKLTVDFGIIKIENRPDFGEGKQAMEEVPEVVGEKREIRQIISGIAPYFPDPTVLIGKKCAFATNLEPRMIRGLESNGMILAAGGNDGEPFTLLNADPSTVPGSLVR